jgi:hypothetical protein
MACQIAIPRTTSPPPQIIVPAPHTMMAATRSRPLGSFIILVGRLNSFAVLRFRGSPARRDGRPGLRRALQYGLARPRCGTFYRFPRGHAAF